MVISILPLTASAKSKKALKFTIELEHSKFSVQQKKKKLVLSCKPAKFSTAGNEEWLRECNNFAFNLLSQEKYQNILVEKYVEDEPFGRLRYEEMKESSATFNKKKSIRKSFKIISD